jgi:hypothetical protein
VKSLYHYCCITCYIPEYQALRISFRNFEPCLLIITQKQPQKLLRL